MRSRLFALMAIGAVVLFAGCNNERSTPVTEKPLLPAGPEIDLIRVSEAVWARETAVGAKGLTPAERVFLCVWNLEAEVNNGGFHQFYLNSAGDLALETPAALREIGAEQAAAIVEQANAVFGPAGPSPDRDARTRALEQLGAATTVLGDLDTRFYEYPDNLQVLLKGFVEHNRDQFFAAK